MSSVLPYNPFSDDTFKMTMGVQALDPEKLIEIDLSSQCIHFDTSDDGGVTWAVNRQATDRYHYEITLKQELLADDYGEYCYAPVETLPEQWEVIALLLPTMARHYPQHFSLIIEGSRWTWRNRLLAQESTFQFGEAQSLPLTPLDWLGRQVQEDLLLLSGDTSKGIPLIAGHLCFPNDWCLRDKLGKSFLHIHTPVPLFGERIGRSSLLLLERLKVGRPVWRVNWAFKATPRLTLTPRLVRMHYADAYKELTPENIGERCFLRVERQTLSRLPRTGAILFTVHTYQTPLASVAHNADLLRRMSSVIRTTPAEMLAYKGMAPFADMLVAYLQSTHRQ